MGRSVARKYGPFVRMFAEQVEGGAADSDEDSGDIDDTEPGGTDDELEGDSEDESEDDGEAALGDPGKKAIDRMKAKLKEERRRRQELEAKYEPPNQSEQDAVARANKKILRSEVKAAAAGKLNDPADAYRFLDLDQFEVSEDGDVDEDEIAAAIAELIESKPYLAKTQENTDAQGERRFKGGAGQGVKTSSGPKQLTEADLDRMSPEQINEARKKGLLNNLLGG